MIKVIIVDDESPARAKLRRLVQEEPDATVVAEASDGTQCLEAIRNHGADVVFLDVQMPGVTGIEVARVLVRERNPLVVFVSAHESYAVTAFSLEVTDYLLKPVAPARFRATFARIRRALNLRSSAAVHVDASRYVKRLLLKKEDRELVVSTGEVDWIESERNYVHVHTRNGTYQHRTTLMQLLSKLDPSEFLQVNRSAIVRFDAIGEISPWGRGDSCITLKSGAIVAWSHRYRRATSIG